MMIHKEDFKTISELQESKIPILQVINIETLLAGGSNETSDPMFYGYRVWYWI